MTVSEGAPAPDFTLAADGGRTIDRTSLKGRNAVLYFYPKDDTSGCTKEAIDFTGLKAEFDAADTEVIGISKDSVGSHAKFAKKHSLDVALGSDEAGAVCEAFGTWVEKSMYGRKYMGIERATFVLDREGVVRRVWRKVKVPGHAAEVLAAAKALP